MPGPIQDPRRTPMNVAPPPPEAPAPAEALPIPEELRSLRQAEGEKVGKRVTRGRLAERKAKKIALSPQEEILDRLLTVDKDTVAAGPEESCL